MKNLLLADIEAQGDDLVRVVDHLYGAERGKIEAAARFLDNQRPTVFIGVASAEFVCMPAVVELGRKGRLASVLGAADALYSYLPALREANVVINTRSGETVEVVKLGKALVESKIPFVAVTNEPESTLAKMAKHVIWAKTRKDELVSINVVSGMMTATLVLAAAILGELETRKDEFAAMAAEMRGVVKQSRQRAGEMLDLFAGIRPIYLLYRAQMSGAAFCGRLVLEEVSRSPAIAMEAAEFRQGPNEVVDEEFGAVVFVPEGKQGELNLALGNDILRSGGRVMLVGNISKNALDGAGGRSLVFPIPEVSGALQSVLAVVPLQLLAFERATAKGLEPGQVRYISKVILSEEGIPNQAN
ncbi:MAG: SIS domain-containing protein [Anaerolineaceae bacterium]|nr:SIS domain-containing protein [Anaerolineaceae bacterium]